MAALGRAFAAAAAVAPPRTAFRRRAPPCAKRVCSSCRGSSRMAGTTTRIGANEPSSSLVTSVAPLPPIPTFQEAIQRLQQYWASHGCTLWLPHNTEVGAGTMNPGTFLRVLGPEPWSVAYTEPSIRPDDSRYGDNPNRVQRHTQFQVVLKPEPPNAQELYLGSLRALGIDVAAHDMRFVEDNWESPVLGAWGLGWEVWMDGMEVTQYTYFQQCGSLQLSPNAVEITYGLERILMVLQGVDHFKDIRYTDRVSYGELFLQNEYEMSVYNMDEADVGNVKARFDSYETAAKDLLAKRLPVPAYDNVLKTSHAFNVLDARGAVGVTERARYFGRMRALARDAAKLWVERREELEYPLGVHKPSSRAPVMPINEAVLPQAPHAFVLELGSEELPAQDVSAGIAQLNVALPGLLDKLRIAHGSVRISGTPRRLWALVEGLAHRQEERTTTMRGPPAQAGFDANGNPTKAVQGFCRKNGVTPAQLTRKADARGVEYLYADVTDVGRPTGVVLAEALPGLVEGLKFSKVMRWQGSGGSYSRPLRWLLAMHGDAVLPFEALGVQSGRTTRTMRDELGCEPITDVPSAEAYLETVTAAGVAPEASARRAAVVAATAELAAQVGGVVPADDGLLEEVTNLVEAPTPMMGAFDDYFLELPREVLVTVMRKHQRYFPVEDPATGRLLPHFITIANGACDKALVRNGNEAVLRARYADARFFYEADLKKPLVDFSPSLEGITFQAELGSMLDKCRRVEAVVPRLCEVLGLDAAATSVAAEAAPLINADLGTAVVTEFTDLAGIMGRYYARAAGHSEDVARAVFEVVLPRNSGDKVAESAAGVALALADRLDSLIGLIAVVGVPTATADPFALRRIAYGLVQTAITADAPLDLRVGCELAASAQPVAVEQQAIESALAFVARRLEQLLVDCGMPIECVRAVLVERAAHPAAAAAAVAQLAARWESAAFAAVLAAYARPTRIVRGKEEAAAAQVNPALFEHEEERALFEAVCEVRAQLDEAEDGASASGARVNTLLDASQRLIAPMSDFFENVFVMAEDEEVRANRLALLRLAAALPAGVLDFSALPGW